MKGRILYFERAGKRNTEATLGISRQRAEELGIKQIIVASTHGYTAMCAREVFGGSGVEIIAVSICAGFAEKGWTMTPAERADLEAVGIQVLTCIHALGE